MPLERDGTETGCRRGDGGGEAPGGIGARGRVYRLGGAPHGDRVDSMRQRGTEVVAPVHRRCGAAGAAWRDRREVQVELARDRRAAELHVRDRRRDGRRIRGLPRTDHPGIRVAVDVLDRSAVTGVVQLSACRSVDVGALESRETDLHADRNPAVAVHITADAGRPEICDVEAHGSPARRPPERRVQGCPGLTGELEQIDLRGAVRKREVVAGLALGDAAVEEPCLRLDDDRIGDPDGDEEVVALGRSHLNARPRCDRRNGDPERAEEGRDVRLLDLDVGPLDRWSADPVTCRPPGARVSPVRAVERSVTIRVDVDGVRALVRDLRVHRAGSRGVTSVLLRHLRDHRSSCRLRNRVGPEAGGQAVLILDPGCERSRIGPVLELTLVREPVADVESERKKEDEDRRDDGKDRQRAAALLACERAQPHPVPRSAAVWVIAPPQTRTVVQPSIPL